LTLFTVVYVAVTPHKEFALIRAGNTAAAVSLSGAVIGFVLPLASVIVNSLNLIDTLVWGAVALVVQIMVFLIARVLIPGLPKAIEEGQVATAWMLAAFSIAVGVLNAACMTY
jgi:putative membrane protein